MDLTLLNPVPPAPKQGVKNAQTKIYVGVAIAAMVVVVAGVVTIAVFGIKQLSKAVQGPMTALNIYTECLVQQDYRSAYEIASPELRKSTSLDELVEFHKELTDKYGRLKNAKQTTWNLATNNGVTSATVRAELNFERCTVPFEFQLRKVDNVWRVYSYKSMSQVGAN